MTGLVIVESPAKAKTINKYLGSDYKVVSSYGHVRDLPSKPGSVEPDRDFDMHYEINPKASKHVKTIIDLAKKSDKIYLASDPDREGEAISWHVAELIKQKKALKKGVEIKRIAFHEITKASVLSAIEKPRDISMDLVNAQQARRALDYLVGFTLSPILWRKLPGSRSAGRVQSVALRLICDREDEIEKFITNEYWTIKCLLNNEAKDEFFARLISIDGKKLEKLDLANEGVVKPLVAKLEKADYYVKSIEKKQQKRNPYPPFITSTLQQEASRKLGFGAKKTMTIAQKLYESGLITYMRTDGVQLSEDAVKEARKYISSEIGEKYLPDSPRVYKTKVKNAQEAHEAIRPTNVFDTPQKISASLEKDHLSLYDLIWRRMLACQMNSVILDQVNVCILTKDNNAELKATGSTIAFDGFYKIYKESLDKENSKDSADEESGNILPPLKEGEDLGLLNVLPEQHFTEPPPRYSEASLVKKLEELGIGRPSTYATIISVLQDRNYVRLDKKRFIPEDRGRLVTAFLISFFNKYVEYDFTAKLEDDLDLISDGKVYWKELLKEFWDSFYKNTKEVSKHTIDEITDAMTPLIEHYVFPHTEEGKDPHQCPDCKDGRLGIRIGKFGPFVACSRYPDCKYHRKFDIHNSDGEGNDSEDGSSSGDRLLGVDPATKLEIFLKKGPYGFYVQLGEKDDPLMKRSPVPKTFKPDELTIEQAMALLALPREVGIHPETNEVIKANIGRFGPYLLHSKKFTSLPSIDDVFSISLEKALEVISKNPKAAARVLGVYKKNEVSVLKGRFGPYIKYGKKNVKLPKGEDPETITLEAAQRIIDEQLK